jgi:hypothetical protein
MVTVRGDPSQIKKIVARAAANGTLANAKTMVTFAAGTLGAIDLTESTLALKEQAEAVNRGDLSSAEVMLLAQASALNAMFGELARRAAANMGEYLQAMEVYLRLALKAQNQSRATLETLAAIKNPPVLYARQANIANGPQQVNNAPPAATGAARAGESEIPPSKLLEGQHAERLDAGAPHTTGAANQELEAMAPINGPPDGRG